MKEEQQIYGMLRVDVAEQKEAVRAAEDWLSLVRIFIEPTYFKVEEDIPESFDLAKVKKLIKELGDVSEVTWLIGDEENELSFSYFKGRILEKYLLSKSVFQVNQSLLKDYLLRKMTTYSGVMAYLRDFAEYRYNNISAIDERLLFETKEELEQLPMLRTLDGKKKIDCNQLAGYDIYSKGLCFTSCWQMYFGQPYYTMIPKQIFQEVQQIEYVKEHQNQVLEIQLYKDPFNWRHESNLKFQRLFRDQMGFDSLAWDNGVGLLREPYIEYIYPKDFIHTVQYQNDSLQPTPKKTASHFITRSYDLVKGAYKEKRVKGALNAQAFFPWVDEAQSKMVAYRVIDPELTLDNGLAAYTYYIRDYLDIDVIDDKYPEYEAILRFYIPEKQMEQIPFDEIFKHFPDTKISQIKRKKGTISVELKKEKNHLRVLFLDYNQLNEFIEIQGPQKV
ncbi:hypothetical protein BAU15_10885 [Enterococcus sp. JM4C]|uniref:hypothetical protein n=1 Tax=Candidatus Enterococcus huntleyi TaxID=1857217 RepID=UPI00137AE88D|nr:hypothetical protein [Enterococcus sp. JM4C]KAF1298624.1 hypothetical protein BAU15_10885 [Enterococcus sp. JM4C]